MTATREPRATGLVFIVALVDNIAHAMRRPIPGVEHWPYLLLGVLGLFLLLQFFSLLFSKDESRDRPPPNL